MARRNLSNYMSRVRMFSRPSAIGNKTLFGQRARALQTPINVIVPEIAGNTVPLPVAMHNLDTGLLCLVDTVQRRTDSPPIGGPISIERQDFPRLVNCSGLFKSLLHRVSHELFDDTEANIAVRKEIMLDRLLKCQATLKENDVVPEWTTFQCLRMKGVVSLRIALLLAAR